MWSRSKQRYIDADPLEGCILMNIGDVLQRWTDDRLLSARHRVIIPRDIGLFEDNLPSSDDTLECLHRLHP